MGLKTGKRQVMMRLRAHGGGGRRGERMGGGPGFNRTGQRDRFEGQASCSAML